MCVCTCVCVCVRACISPDDFVRPLTFTLLHASQLLLTVMLCAKRRQRTRTLPGLSPYLWMEHVLPAIPMYAFAKVRGEAIADDDTWGDDDAGKIDDEGESDDEEGGASWEVGGEKSDADEPEEIIPVVGGYRIVGGHPDEEGGDTGGGDNTVGEGGGVGSPDLYDLA